MDEPASEFVCMDSVRQMTSGALIKRVDPTYYTEWEQLKQMRRTSDYVYNGEVEESDANTAINYARSLIRVIEGAAIEDIEKA